jgi:TolB-like protein/Tfp pilus assembly protein PilF/predicted Ser/Thr protein kinase
MTLAPGTKLGPYEILSHIGTGGMGEVYHARDTRLDRTVAIKVLNREHMQRFEREAHAIAALNHPHICTLYDIGPDYLVMEYVDGTAIKGPLPVEEAVRLAIQIASALDQAHRIGILHRDLKPGNIMVTRSGTAKLLDFGLAKLAAGAELDTASTITMDGTVMGTPAYMSPEQAQGKPVDERSDIFSFGAVLYEILSGSRAFDGTSTAQALSAVLCDEPRPLKTLPQLDRIVRHCLAKQPAQRFRTMTEVKAALEKISIRPAEEQPSIAVLPFVNMSGDKEQEYFSDGLAEEIINALTQIPGLRVAARTSSFFFRGKDVEFVEIGKRLNVGHILEGSVRKAGGRIRVTAQLIKVADGFHLWSERYDREMTDVFAIQDEISQSIAEKLRIRFAGGRPLVKRHTKNVEAYNLYLKGWYHLSKFTAVSIAKSKEYFEQAIEMDPDYTLAWHGVAMYHWYLGYMGFMPPKEANVQCRQAAMKALQLDETLAEAHSLMAMLLASEFDWERSEAEFRRALQLDPESTSVLTNYGKFYLVPMRRFDEAIELSRRALELDPLSPPLQWELGHRYLFMGQLNRAIDHYRNALELDPQYYLAMLFIGLIDVWAGRVKEGIQACELAVDLGGRSYAHSIALLAVAYAMAGRIDDAKRTLGQFHDLARNGYISPTHYAYIYLGLGEIDKSLDWIEKAVEAHDSFIFHFVVGQVQHFLNDPLRSHSRYHALLRKMNLEP